MLDFDAKIAMRQLFAMSDLGRNTTSIRPTHAAVSVAGALLPPATLKLKDTGTGLISLLGASSAPAAWLVQGGERIVDAEGQACER